MPTTASDRPASAWPDPWSAAVEYATDAWQRSILYADVMRQRGNQYQEHMASKAPNVLAMKSELVLDGRTLERPVNYGLSRVLPYPDTPADPRKRPFVVVDPRAGHGPGIGGFKPESEIGVAIRAGHPCYFIGFLPQPEPGQTVEDVIRAEARFLEEVIALHPQAEGKPVVIGNCQAGWQVMMTAAMRPELFGPIIVAGAPLSYWAGWRGRNPMRYFGGMLGGSWSTAMLGDLGAGKFDGAWLVQNFENLNPANTLWTKQYSLYSHVDTEADRYLGFEKWWGGHVFLNAVELQYIVDNLFIGNRLATANLVTSDGVRLDLRNIRSPIIVFCSKGDNITPPPQALGWIPDLYRSDEEIRAHNQTIVYAVHESIGHLGIFVSGSVARKEHQEFTSNIDLIDILPPGLYQADIREKTPDMPNADLADGDYVLNFGRRKLDDVREIVANIPEDEKRFAAAARISDINLGLYRNLVQPWLRQWVTPAGAELMQQLHPLRLPYETISNRNPLVAPVAQAAAQVRKARRPASPDNPFVQLQEMAARAIEASLEIWTGLRDDAIERVFMAVYGSPLVQGLAGLDAHDEPLRRHPGISAEHRKFMLDRAQELRAMMGHGGVREAAVRMLLYVSQGQGGIDERCFNVIRRMREHKDGALNLQAFKKVVRDQALTMMLDLPAALKAMPQLLANHATPAQIREAFRDMQEVVTAGMPLTEVSTARLEEMRDLFEAAARRAEADMPGGAQHGHLEAEDATPSSVQADARPAPRAAARKAPAAGAARKRAPAGKAGTKPAAVKTAAAKPAAKAAATPPRAPRTAKAGKVKPDAPAAAPRKRRAA